MKFRNKDLGIYDNETFNIIIIIIINFISFLNQGSKWGRKEVVRLGGDFKWYVKNVKVLILILLSINYKRVKLVKGLNCIKMEVLGKFCKCQKLKSLH